jgi:hypothetical protein
LIYANESCLDTFEAYLAPFVTLERLNLDEAVANLLTGEKEACMPFAATVISKPGGQETIMSGVVAATTLTSTTANAKDPFPSAQRMFEFMKSSMKRCGTVSTGLTLIALSREFHECLQRYCESMMFRFPTPTKDATYDLPLPLEAELCRIIATANFCAELIPQLENGLRSMVDTTKADPEDIDFTVAVDNYLDLCSTVMGILTSHMTEQFGGPCKSMRQENWSDPEYRVGDDSAYVKRRHSAD